MKALAPWFHKKQFGLWQAALQSEKPMSLGWLLFSTQIMDIDVLKEAISTCINGVPLGLDGK